MSLMTASGYMPDSYYPNKDQWQAQNVLGNHLPAQIQEAMDPKPLPRRVKRMVADQFKDIKYWERRKRNNDAARKSRENRRAFDQNLRTRLFVLEEENTLLRKEISVLKAKFGLLSNQRYLSLNEHGELFCYPIQKTFAQRHHPEAYEKLDQESDSTSDHWHIAGHDQKTRHQTRESQQYNIIQGTMQNTKAADVKMMDGKGSTFDSESSLGSSEGTLSPKESDHNTRSIDEKREISLPMKKRKKMQLEINSPSDEHLPLVSSKSAIPKQEQMMFSPNPSPQPTANLPQPSTSSSARDSRYNYLSEAGHTQAHNKEHRSSQINYESQFLQLHRVLHNPPAILSRIGEDRKNESFNDMPHPRGYYTYMMGDNELTTRQAGYEVSNDFPRGGKQEITTQRLIGHEAGRLESVDIQVRNGEPRSSVLYDQVEHNNKDEYRNGFSVPHVTEQQKETDELRSRLRVLSEEVAKMKTFVMTNDNQQVIG